MKLQKRHWAPFCACVIYVQDVLLIFKDIDNGASAQPSPSVFGSHNGPLCLWYMSMYYGERLLPLF